MLSTLFIDYCNVNFKNERILYKGAIKSVMLFLILFVVINGLLWFVYINKVECHQELKFGYKKTESKLLPLKFFSKNFDNNYDLFFISSIYIYDDVSESEFCWFEFDVQQYVINQTLYMKSLITSFNISSYKFRMSHTDISIIKIGSYDGDQIIVIEEYDLSHKKCLSLLGYNETEFMPLSHYDAFVRTYFICPNIELMNYEMLRTLIIARSDICDSYYSNQLWEDNVCTGIDMSSKVLLCVTGSISFSGVAFIISRLYYRWTYNHQSKENVLLSSDYS